MVGIFVALCKLAPFVEKDDIHFTVAVGVLFLFQQLLIPVVGDYVGPAVLTRVGLPPDHLAAHEEAPQVDLPVPVRIVQAPLELTVLVVVDDVRKPIAIGILFVPYRLAGAIVNGREIELPRLARRLLPLDNLPGGVVMDEEVHLSVCVGIAFLANETPSLVVAEAVNFSVVVGIFPCPLKVPSFIEEIPGIGLAVPIAVLLLLFEPVSFVVIPYIGSAVAVGILLLPDEHALLIHEPDIRPAVSVLIHLLADDLARLVEELDVRARGLGLYLTAQE